MLVSLVVWIGLLAGLLAMSSFLEKRAAMRGTNRRPLPDWVDKAIRCFFLAVFITPVFAVFPWPSALFVATLLYLPTYLDGSEKKGNRLSELVRRLPVWWWMKRYFSIEIDHRMCGKLDPKRQYVIGMHPHGFLPLGSMVTVLSDICNVNDEVFNGVKVRALAASFCFYIPIYRDLLLAGGVIDAARYNAARALKHGVSLALVPGGASEGLYASPGSHKLVLKNRRGFIKLALEHGCDLLPLYSFGETDCYEQLHSMWPPIRHFQAKFQRVLGLSLPLVKNIIPMRAKITIVFGTPIHVEKVAEPSQEQVEKLLQTYIASLTELFNANAEKYIPNPENRKLEIM
ncbi:hypothetical protein DIPPA_17108 [Diplonema papillatum]|nr:hypothetical protein DIPPA_17108 [Diplonema papillatum]|eukprot:gene11126-17106_t